MGTELRERRKPIGMSKYTRYLYVGSLWLLLAIPKVWTASYVEQTLIPIPAELTWGEGSLLLRPWFSVAFTGHRDRKSVV